MTLIAVSIFLALPRRLPDWSWLELIPLIALLTVFATGLGLLLSVLYVRFRDMKPIWDVVGQMLFYASPVLYVATTVPGGIPAPVHGQPDRRGPDPDAPRGRRSDGAHAPPRRSAAPRDC